MGNDWMDTGNGPGWPLPPMGEFTPEEKAKLAEQEPVDPPEHEPID